MLILQAWSWLTFYSLLATAVLVNKTIDDTYGDGQGNFIQYLPVGAWNNGPECNGCSAKPDDKSKVYSESWHDGDFSTNPDHTFANQILTATAMFNGSAIYVFCVLAKTIPSILDGDSDMTFYIDGVQVGTFVQSGDDTPTSYQYQVPVYQNEALTPGLHNFTLANGHINGTESLVLLDRIVYTYDDGIPDTSGNSPSSSPPSPPAGDETSSQTDNSTHSSRIIAVAISVPIVCLLLFGVGLWWFLKRRAKTKQSRRLTSTTLNLNLNRPGNSIPSNQFIQGHDIRVQPFDLLNPVESQLHPPASFGSRSTSQFSEKRTAASRTMTWSDTYSRVGGQIQVSNPPNYYP